MNGTHNRLVLSYDRRPRRRRSSIAVLRVISLSFLFSGVALAVSRLSGRDFHSLAGYGGIVFIVFGLAGYLLSCIMTWDEQRMRTPSLGSAKQPDREFGNGQRTVSYLREENGFVD